MKWFDWKDPYSIFISVLAVIAGGLVLWALGHAVAPNSVPVVSLAVLGVGPQPPVNIPPTPSGGDQLPNCGNQQPVSQMLAYFLDPNNNNIYTKVSTTGFWYIAGSPTAAANVTTSATQTVATAPGELSCGASYKEFAGDQGTTYYFSATPSFVVNNGVMTPANNGKGIQVVPYGDVVLSAKTSNSLYDTNTTLNWTAAHGGVNATTDSSSVTLKVQAPSAPAEFGDLGYAHCFIFYSADFSDVRINGAKVVSISSVKPNFFLGDTVECSEVPTVASGTTQEYNLVMKGAPSGPANGDIISDTLVPKSNELYNGYLIPTENAAAGVTSNGYDSINNPSVQIVAHNVTTYGIVTIVR